MGWLKLTKGCFQWRICLWLFWSLISMLSAPICRGYTDPLDIFAINSLYADLGFPSLPGWLPMGGDPCAENWQGVLCVNANITGIVLTGANLGGQLGESLGAFTSIIQIDLSNNHIGGTIPSNLPVTIRSFFLSDNQFTGSIPTSLSSLGQLSDLSFNNNHLSGEIPDAFQPLTGLINLDLSGNNLSGQLPPSFGKLSSVTTLHLQNNQLSGTLNVLEDLPLQDLNIENNLFWGPVPDKLLSIPNFRRAGNPFNTTVIPSPPASPPASAPSPSSLGAPPPDKGLREPANGPSAALNIQKSNGGGNFFKIKRVAWIAVAGFLILVVILLGLSLFMSRCCKGRYDRNNVFGDHRKKVKNKSSTKPNNLAERVPKETFMRQPSRHGKDYGRDDPELEPKEGLEKQCNRMADVQKHKDEHVVDMSEFDENILLPPPPPPFPLLPADKTLNPRTNSIKSLNSARSFTIALLQQYTNSFSQENLIGGGMVGTVYKAQLPNGMILVVKKLDNMISRRLSNDSFLDLVSSIFKLQHAHIVKLVGYCAEHGQWLLVYEYFENGTLYEALHLDEVIHKKLSWNSRIRLALGAAKALEYLHEVCQPPIVHQNFKSANILLDDELAVRVSDCGLAPLLPSGSMSQLQENGYGAPELELGSYTLQSDVYSFGVVMLELLTGRTSFDRSRPRGEQSLVRWAIPRLHDIDALSRMVDPSLNGVYSSKSLSRFADIISLCVQPEPEFRPPMSEIVQNLLQMIQRDR